MKPIRRRYIVTFVNCHLMDTMNLEDTTMVEIGGYAYWGFGEHPQELKSLGLLLLETDSYALAQNLKAEMDKRLRKLLASGYVDTLDSGERLLPQLEGKVAEMSDEILDDWELGDKDGR